MSIFDSVLEKLGIQKPAAPAAPAAPSAKAAPVKPAGPAHMAPNGPPPTRKTFIPSPPKPVEMPMVDVVTMLDRLAKESPIQGLNWKMSINDLMALLGLDHSGAGIKQLAVELGCPESEMGDSYKRNVWSHKALLKKIAENGGNIPQNLLH